MEPFVGLQRGCHQPITPVPPVAGAPTTLSIAPCLHLPVGHPGRPHTHREGMIHDCRPRAGRTEPLARLHPAPGLCRLLPTERLCLPATSAGGRGREPGTPSFSVSLLLNSYTIDVTSDCLQVTLERAGDPWLFMKTVPAILKTTPPPIPATKRWKGSDFRRRLHVLEASSVDCSSHLWGLAMLRNSWAEPGLAQ